MPRNHLLPESCDGCVLSENPACGKFTAVSGQGRFNVLIVAEASGKEEAEEGRPLIEWAPSGSIIEKAIRKRGWRREDFWMTNILRCRPPNNFLEGAPYEREAIAHCKGNLDRVIESLRPRAILSLGGVATRELTGFTGGKRGVTYTRGYALRSRYGIPCIPSLHPAFLARGNTKFLGLLMRDLGEAVAYASGRKTLVEDPSMFVQVKSRIEDLEELYERAKSDPKLWIAYDIETDESIKGDEDGIIEFERTVSDANYGDGTGEVATDVADLGFGEHADWGESEANDEGGSRNSDQLDILSARINSIQFAISSREGVFVRWDDRVRELAQRIEDLPNPKIGWNNNLFDDPIMRRHGIIFRTLNHDGMYMYKAMQADLPAHLQGVAAAYGWPFPWKHMAGAFEEFYGVCDVCSLIMIVERLPGELQRAGLWEGYLRFKQRAREKVLALMESTGLPMDRERLDELRIYLTQEIEGMRVKIEEEVPPELHQMSPVDGYKNMPPSIKEYVLGLHPDAFAPTLKTYKNGTSRLIKSKVQLADLYHDLVLGSLMHLENGNKVITLGNVLQKYPELRLGEFDYQLRLYEHVPFNPKSSKQLISYIKLKGYPVPKCFKDGTETTASKEMVRLIEQTGDPVLKLAHETRIHEKMRDSYTGKMGEDGVARGGWIPDSDGRLRARYTFKSTWQLAATPNVLTMPKRRGELAKKFRRCMVAEPGRLLVVFDYKAFHDLTTALEATDEIKWRVASKADPHAFVAGFLVKYPGIETCLSLSDADLNEFLNEVRSKHEDVREYQAKPANHGTNFGQGPRRLQFEHREHFPTLASAQRVLSMLKKVFPRTFQWQEEILEVAEAQGYLQSRWGARRWLWDTFSWKKGKQGRWYRTKGQDAEKAMAFLPANDAHGMLMDKLLDMEELGYLEKYRLVNSVHDELVFEPPKDLLEECIHNVREWMQGPVMTLAHPILCPDGFVCRVDVSFGPDRATMEKAK